jgi:hypothetical protein
MVSAAPWPRPLPPDSSDTMFLEVAHSTSEKTLIIGNLKHFPASCRGQVRVYSPREALVMLTGRAQARPQSLVSFTSCHPRLEITAMA